MATVLPPDDEEIEAPTLSEGGDRLLPFSFAKRHGLLVHGYEEGQAQTIVRDDASLTSLSEVRR